MPGFFIPGGDSGSESPLGKASATQEAHRVHRWRIDQLGPLPADKLSCIYAKSLRLPEITFDEEALQTGSSIIYKFAKYVRCDDIVVTIYDVIGAYQAEIAKWRDQVWDAANGTKMANDYMDTCVFVVGDPYTNGYKIIAYNCWPKRISHGDLSYENSAIKTIELTLSCSHISIQLAESVERPFGSTLHNDRPPQTNGTEQSNLAPYGIPD